MNADEDNKFHKEIVKNFLCVSPNYGKKIARMLFNKDLKCGNIFLNLEEEPNEKNKIVLDNTEKDPMVFQYQIFIIINQKRHC